MNNVKQKLTNHSLGLIGALIVQYVLGMLTNLFVAFPDSNSPIAHWEFARGQWLIMSHIIVGTLIVIGTVALYVRAVKLKDKTWKIAGGITLGSVILAWLSGEEFITSQTDVHSFSMALFFLIALLSLGWGVYRSRS